jgi:CDP-2,3-bis-(O-geranylgeranyl)-sn-glycerol synthase
MGPIQELVDWPALLLLIAANGTPVIVARLLGHRYGAPIDANRAMRDGRPLFGPHKTWRGAIAGSLAAGLTGLVLATGFAIGAVFGALALIGDLFSSFVKRRFGCASGRSLPLLDQLPEALLPMLCLRTPLNLDLPEVIGTTILFSVLDMLTARFRT